MELSEKDLEDYIYMNPEVIHAKRWLGRQMITKMGILDLIGIGEYDNLLLVELKAVPYHPKHIAQINRYESCLLDLAVEFGYTPLSISRSLVVRRSELSSKTLFEIEASDIWLIDYSFNSRSNTILFDQPLKYFNHKENESRHNNSSDVLINYLVWVKDHQPEWMNNER